MKVWMVTQGEYSDYHVEGIFDSEAAANAYIARECQRHNWCSANDFNVDEIEVNTSKFTEFWGYKVTFIASTGDIHGVNDLGLCDREWLQRNKEVQCEEYYLGEQRYGARTPVHIVLVLASNEEKARRIAIEKRTKWLAQKEGL